MEDREDLRDCPIPNPTKGAERRRGGNTPSAAAAPDRRLKETYGEGHSDLGVHFQDFDGGVEGGQGGGEGAGEGSGREALVWFAGQSNVFDEGIERLERPQGFEGQRGVTGK